MLAKVITGIMAIVSLKWGGNDFYTCIIKNPAVFVIGGISGTCLVVGISRLIQCNSISRIGQHTLTIMGTHQLFIYAPTPKQATLFFQDAGVILNVLVTKMFFRRHYLFVDCKYTE